MYSCRFFVETKGLLKRKKKLFLENVPSKKCFQLLDSGSLEVKQSIPYSSILNLETSESEVVIHVQQKKKNSKIVFSYKSKQGICHNLVTELLKHASKVPSPIKEQLPYVFRSVVQQTKKGMKYKIQLKITKYCYTRTIDAKEMVEFKDKTFNDILLKDITRIKLVKENANVLVITTETYRTHIFHFGNKDTRNVASKIISFCLQKFFSKVIKPEILEGHVKNFVFFKENAPKRMSKSFSLNTEKTKRRTPKSEILHDSLHSVKVEKLRIRSMYYKGLESAKTGEPIKDKKNMSDVYSKKMELCLSSTDILEFSLDMKIVTNKKAYADIYKIIRYKKNYVLLEFIMQHPYFYKFESGVIRDEFLTSMLEICLRNKIVKTISLNTTDPRIKVDGKNYYNSGLRKHVYYKMLSKEINLGGKKKMERDDYAQWNTVVCKCVENFEMVPGSLLRQRLGVDANVKKTKVKKDPTTGLTKVIQMFFVLSNNILKNTSVNDETGSTFVLDANAIPKEQMYTFLNLLHFIIVILSNEKVYDTNLFFEEKFVENVWQLAMIENNPLISFYAFSIVRFSVNKFHPFKNETRQRNNRVKYFKGKKTELLLNMIVNYKNDIKLNALPLYMSLTILESMLFSTCSATARPLFSAFLTKIVTPMLPDLHFFMYFSKSVGIIYNSSVLIKCILLKVQNDEIQYQETKIQFLKEIYFLQHFHTAISTKDMKFQIKCSSDIVGLLSEENNFVHELYTRMLPNTELLKELIVPEDKTDTSDHSTVVFVNKGKKLNLSVSPVLRYKKNWRRFLLSLKGTHNSIYLVWNGECLTELCRKLKREINDFLKAKDTYHEKLIWNFDEFKVSYEILKTEPVVGNYFIKFLKTSDVVKKEKIMILDPHNFIEKLVHELLFNNEDDNHIVICLRACTTVYTNYKRQIGKFQFMGNLCQFITSVAKSKEVIFETMNFLLSLFVLEENIAMFEKNNGIELLLPFLEAIYDDVEFASGDDHIYDAAIDKTSVNVRITKLCVEILIILTSFRLCVNKEGKLLVPKPISIRKMCQPIIISKVTQFLLINDSELFLKTISLLSYLTLNDDIFTKMYQTGLFFFVFLYQGDDFYTVLKLLSELHSHQDLAKDLREYYTGGRKDYSPYISSALNGILPREIVYQIEKFSKELNNKKKENGILWLSKVFKSGDYDSPRIVWNSKLKKNLQKQIKEYLRPFFREIKARKYKNSEENVKSNEDLIQEIIEKDGYIHAKYHSLDRYVVCYHYYVKNFCNVLKWPKEFLNDFVNDNAEILKFLNSLKVIVRNRNNEERMDVLSESMKCLLLLYQIEPDNFADFYTDVDYVIKYLNELMFTKTELDDSEIISAYQTTSFLYLALKKCYRKVHFSKVFNIAIQIITKLVSGGLFDIDAVKTIKPKRREDHEIELNEFTLDGLNKSERYYHVITRCLKIIFFYARRIFERINVQFEKCVQQLRHIFIKLLGLPVEKTVEMKRILLDLLDIFVDSEILQKHLIVDSGILLFIIYFVSLENKLSQKATLLIKLLCGKNVEDNEEEEEMANAEEKDGGGEEKNEKDNEKSVISKENETALKVMEVVLPKDLDLNDKDEDEKREIERALNRELCKFLEGEIRKLNKTSEKDERPYDYKRMLGFKYPKIEDLDVTVKPDVRKRRFPSMKKLPMPMKKALEKSLREDEESSNEDGKDKKKKKRGEEEDDVFELSEDEFSDISDFSDEETEKKIFEKRTLRKKLKSKPRKTLPTLKRKQLEKENELSLVEDSDDDDDLLEEKENTKRKRKKKDRKRRKEQEGDDEESDNSDLDLEDIDEIVLMALPDDEVDDGKTDELFAEESDNDSSEPEDPY